MMANGDAGQRSGSVGGAIGTGLGILVRSLSQKQPASGASDAAMQGDRLAKGLIAGGKTVVKSATRVANILFLQVVGFVFVVLSLSFVYPALQAFHKYKAGLQGPDRAIVGSLFVVMFLYFGLTSFWRARKK